MPIGEAEAQLDYSYDRELVDRAAAKIEGAA